MPRTALLALQDAFSEFENTSLLSELPDEEKPSALLVCFRPGEKPNSKFQIDGDPYELAEVMLAAAKDKANPYFRDAMLGLIPELLNLAHES